MKHASLIVLSLLLGTLAVLPLRAQDDPAKKPTPESSPTWQEIGPLLDTFCTHCHGGSGPTRGLDLGTLAGVKKGSRGGPVIDTKDPSRSVLVLRLRAGLKPQMPLDGPPFLSDEQIARILAWIDAGMPEGTLAKPPDPKTEEDSPTDIDKPAEDTIPPRGRKIPGPDDPVTWAHVSPIFAKRCVHCHKNGGIRGNAPEGLELFSLERILAGGERVALVPGNPLASPILRHIRGIASPRMPLDGPPYLSHDEITLIERWVRTGAQDSTGKPSPIPVGRQVRYRGRLTGPHELDGLPFHVDRGTRIDKSPRVGDEAEVRGVIQPDGSVRATRLRRR